ncbi:hypothetical protein NDU88_003168 [Pleurodeles waltl]|uniref:Uncharacterized protein n=1 Tax=Pleurodeles waltl TaxID=8319 RepID=A0AAV7M367_PLEWA|nr:hypothetical protein NDU88_003168 [Pleurodeles waltl]
MPLPLVLCSRATPRTVHKFLRSLLVDSASRTSLRFRFHPVPGIKVVSSFLCLINSTVVYLAQWARKELDHSIPMLPATSTAPLGQERHPLCPGGGMHSAKQPSSGWDLLSSSARPLLPESLEPCQASEPSFACRPVSNPPPRGLRLFPLVPSCANISVLCSRSGPPLPVLYASTAWVPVFSGTRAIRLTSCSTLLHLSTDDDGMGASRPLSAGALMLLRALAVPAPEHSTLSPGSPLPRGRTHATWQSQAQ